MISNKRFTVVEQWGNKSNIRRHFLMHFDATTNNIIMSVWLEKLFFFTINVNDSSRVIHESDIKDDLIDDIVGSHENLKKKIDCIINTANI